MSTHPSHPNAVSASPTIGRYAQVNGLNLYYEIHGAGQPTVLLHGAFSAIPLFGPVLSQLATGRQLIAVEMQAHGHTADIDRPLSLEAMADDIAALLRQLQIARADVVGYSMGGGIALQIAIRHPALVRKLVVVSFPFTRQGWYPEVLAGLDQLGPEAAEAMRDTPMYAVYAASAPRVADWTVLVTKLGAMQRTEYDWSTAVGALKLPTLLVFGDADSVRTADAVAFFEQLGGGQRDGGPDRAGMSSARLAILPGTTHYEIDHTLLLAQVVAAFLDEAEAEHPAAPAAVMGTGAATQAR